MIWLIGFLIWALLVTLILMFFMGATMTHIEDDESSPASIGRDDIDIIED